MALPSPDADRAVGRQITVQGIFGLIAGMGIGRFAFTPLLPVMTDAGVISSKEGAWIATANYLGYLAGAVALAAWPARNTRRHYQAWIAVLALSEAAMALSQNALLLSLLRVAAGYASAVIFVGVVSTINHYRRAGASAGVAFGGVGLGIAIMGLFELTASHILGWRWQWVAVAILTAVSVSVAWRMDVRPEQNAAPRASAQRLSDDVRRAWWLLIAAYFLEGVGYIIIGTFMVAAAGGSSTMRSVVWLVAGLCAAPAAYSWHRLSRRVALRKLLVIAYAMQVVSALLPVISSGAAAAIVSAALFGGTFLGIAMMTLGQGAQLPIGRTAAVLTSAYGVGQVLGPLVVTPVIGSSFRLAYVIAAIIIVLAAVVSALFAVAASKSGVLIVD